MDRLHLDNAREHHSKALKRGCRTYSIALEYRPRKRPHYGAHIERLIGTMMGAVHLLPGTTFSNVAERGDYQAEGKACMTLAEIEAWLAGEIIGPFRYQRFISDLAGMDIHGHGGDPARALREARDWLANVSRRELPSADRVQRVYEAFLADLPDLAAVLEFDPDRIPYVDFERIVGRWLIEAPAAIGAA